MRRFWLSYPEPNQSLERTAHSAGCLAVFGPVPVGCRSPPALHSPFGSGERPFYNVPKHTAFMHALVPRESYGSRDPARPFPGRFSGLRTAASASLACAPSDTGDDAVSHRTGGGLTPEGHWGAVRNGYLLPGRGVMAVFRGQLLDALRRTFLVETSRCLWRCARSRFSTSSIALVIRRHTGMCG